jgi:acetyl-CoA acyltransferase
MQTDREHEPVIVETIRTPIGKRDGLLKDIHPATLLAAVLRELIARTGIDPVRVDDCIVGCVDQVGEQAENVGRSGWLAAGLPESVPATTVNRMCGSSQQAIHFAAQGVMAGAYDVVVAAGVESMTRVPMDSPYLGRDHFGPELRSRYDDKLIPQSIAAELVAAKWRISREESDDFGYRSHLRAATATMEGRFEREMLPMKVSAAGGETLITGDEGIRMQPDRDRMAQLPPAFKDDRYSEMFPGELTWVVTAGNASQISDGASAVMITSLAAARALRLVPRARFHAFALAGSSPILMLAGPIPATRKVLDRAGLRLQDLDVVEINEAFATVPLAWKKELAIEDGWFEDRVNPNGGAVAIGHPLGASGCRLMTTMLHELERRGGRYGLQTICEGGGLSNATIIERMG